MSNKPKVFPDGLDIGSGNLSCAAGAWALKNSAGVTTFSVSDAGGANLFSNSNTNLAITLTSASTAPNYTRSFDWGIGGYGTAYRWHNLQG